MYIQLKGARLFFDVEGSKLAPDGASMREKPSLVCLHGGPGLDHSGYRPAFSALAELAQVVYLDQRGHGRSDRGGPESWTLARWADDVRDFCDALGIERPVVLGTSFGGYVGMAYASRYPEHPAKLILVSTSARGTGNAARRVNVLRAFERRGGSEAREAVRRAFDERTPEAYDVYGRICGPLYNRCRPDPESSKRIVRSPDVLPYFERPGGEGVTFDLTGELSSIRCPTLVISGEDDPITPVEEQQVIVDSMRPGIVRHLRFPRCGHGVLRDDAAGMLTAVADFISA